MQRALGRHLQAARREPVVRGGKIDHPGHSCAGVSNEAGFPQWLIEAPISSPASGYSLSPCCRMEMRSDGIMYSLLSHQSDTY